MPHTSTITSLTRNSRKSHTLHTWKRNPYKYLDLWNVSPETEVRDNAAHQHDHQLTQEQQEVAHAAHEIIIKGTVARGISVI
jgi:hypothetical protein